jgi:hypothetical protein
MQYHICVCEGTKLDGKATAKRREKKHVGTKVPNQKVVDKH